MPGYKYECTGAKETEMNRSLTIRKRTTEETTHVNVYCELVFERERALSCDFAPFNDDITLFRDDIIGIEVPGHHCTTS